MTDPGPNSRNRIEDMYPLTPMQRGLLFHHLLAPGSGQYMPHIIAELEGAVDSVVLREGWEDAVRQHPVLRTGFFWEERDEPFQVVLRDAALRWSELDWRAWPAEEQREKLEGFLLASRSLSFDPRRPPLMRLSLIRRDSRRYTLIWAYHHLILDGWSAARVIEQVCARLLTGRHSAGDTGSRFADFVAWQRRQPADATESFWRSHLRAPAALTTVPLPPPAPVPEGARTRASRTLSPEATDRLRAFARDQRVTVNTVLQGAFALLLARYNDRSEATFGSTVSGRPPELAGVEEAIGLFINTLPVQVDLPPALPLGDWLRELQHRQGLAAAHEHVSLRDLTTWINDGDPLFECLFVFESYPAPALSSSDGSGLALRDLHFDEQTHFPLTVQVSDGEVLELTARFAADRYRIDHMERLLRHLQDLTAAMVSSANAPLGDFALLSAEETAEQAAWNETRRPLPPYRTITEWLEAQAQASPEAVALRFGTRELSYRALHARAEPLARHLRALGAGPESVVAIHLERALELPVAILGVLKAGAAYLPLDPEQPNARLEAMITDASPVALIVDSRQGLAVLASNGTASVDLARLGKQPEGDDPWPAPAGSTAAACPGSGADNMIYVIYTSGSTGRPKGVINTHGSLVNRLAWMQRRFPLAAGEAVLHKTPVGFDVSAWELLWPLLTGATMVIAEPGRHRDSAYLADLIRSRRIGTVHFVPAMLSAFLDDLSREQLATDLAPLERVILSGEAVTAELQDRFFASAPDVELHNLYGPTEAAIDVTAWACRSDALAGAVPIGSPIDNTQIRILDRDLRELPTGLPGELCIGGLAVARGYLGQTALTAERFVPDPLATSNGGAGLLYRSGDRARWRDDGTIEYLGRMDDQIKLRGVRIEPAEIERSLRRHPGVHEALVVLQSLSGGAQLVAYLTPSDTASDAAERLDDMALLDWQAFLQPKLPPVMVPTVYGVLDALPLSANGKVDRGALPLPGVREVAAHVPPRNETERQISAAWVAVLGVDRVGADDNFFALGGHSLNVIRINTRLRKQLGIELPLAAHFQFPTVEALANHIDAMRIAAGEMDAPGDADGNRVEIEI